MNRRNFLKSMAAAFALPAVPALSLQPAMALPAASPNAAAAAAMATKARFWTIYTCAKQGNCTPATLSTILNIPESQARGYLTNLVADGTIKPHAIFKHSVKRLAKAEADSVVEELPERLDVKAESEVETVVEKTAEPVDDTPLEEADVGTSEVSGDEDVVLEDDMEISELDDNLDSQDSNRELRGN